MTQATSYSTSAGVGMGRVIYAPTTFMERLDDHAMLDLADREGSKSSCPRAFVGAVAITKSGARILGHNGAPHGVEDCETAGCVVIPATDTAREYSRHVHAEASVIAQAADTGARLRGATLWVNVPPCLDCSRLICMAGIAEVVIRTPSEAWRQSVGAYLADGGVSVREVTP